MTRHKARRLAVWNAAIWSIGNGLASTTLVVYLARELHAEGLGLSIGLLLAAPQLAGVLRLGAPVLMGWVGDRRRFCVGGFAASSLLLLVLPCVSAPGVLPTSGWSLAALVSLWCLYHLLQYLAMVALWSWLGDIARQRIRGRFFGWRERWLVLGQAAATVAAGGFVWLSLRLFPGMPNWLPYAVMAGLGAVLMLAALVPLWRMPAAQPGMRRGWHVPERAPCGAWSRRAWSSGHHALRASGRATQSSSMLKPLFDLRFLPLVAYGLWFSFFNGVTQSAQNYFPMQVLGIPLFVSLSLQTGMRLGQSVVSPALGRLADRHGNRAVIIACQLLVASGLLMFAPATAETREWYVMAWVLWIAYAGLNVGVPNLILKLAPGESNASYLAAYYAVTGVAYAVSTIVGGAIVDRYEQCIVSYASYSMAFFPAFFVVGWAARSAGAAWVLLVKERSESERSRDS